MLRKRQGQIGRGGERDLEDRLLGAHLPRFPAQGEVFVQEMMQYQYQIYCVA